MSVRSRLRITTRQLKALVAFLEINKENLTENRKLLQNEAGIVGINHSRLFQIRTIYENLTF
jgi:hypothetical protein